MNSNYYCCFTLALSVMAAPLSFSADVDVSLENTTSFATQDNVSTGSVALIDTDGFVTLELTGNRWRASSSGYDVQAETVLEFEYRSFIEGEIHGIGLDEDNNLSSSRIFKLHGRQNWGRQNVVNYTGEGSFQRFQIPVGNFYTGSNMRVIFVNDNDVSNPSNNGTFRNVRLITPDSDMPPPDADSCEMTAREQALVDAHNAARAEGRTCGETFYPAVPAVTWSCKLGQIAREHSKDMADNDFLSHTGSNGLSPFDRMDNVGYRFSWASENVAAGYRTVDAVMQGWLSSSGHCANIMSGNVTEIGSSAVENPNSQYFIYWTSAFGNPL